MPIEDRFTGGIFAGRFRVEEALGAGGMGRVYRAWQLPMSRWVALKVLDRKLVTEASAIRRFEREMRSAARIDHPNAALVYEFGSSGDGDLYLAMELLHGRTLKAAIRADGAMPAERIARIARQICHALACAHVENIVHRDVKPENVMLVDNFGAPDWVKVLDFGIAQVLRKTTDDLDLDLDPGTLTHQGKIVGTPEYMSPEHILGRELDHRSDLYSLGCVMYEMATGVPPFECDEPMSTLYRQVNEEPRRLPKVAPIDQPPWLESIIQQLLAKDPDRRPASALEVVDLLKRAPTSSDDHFRSTAVLERLREEAGPESQLPSSDEAEDVPADEVEESAAPSASLGVAQQVALVIAAVALVVATLLVVGRGGEAIAEPNVPRSSSFRVLVVAEESWLLEGGSLALAVDTLLKAHERSEFATLSTDDVDPAVLAARVVDELEVEPADVVVGCLDGDAFGDALEPFGARLVRVCEPAS